MSRGYPAVPSFWWTPVQELCSGAPNRIPLPASTPTISIGYRFGLPDRCYFVTLPASPVVCENVRRWHAPYSPSHAISSTRHQSPRETQGLY